jgi:tetratricopeptide (TPR) repeat protein
MLLAQSDGEDMKQKLNELFAQEKYGEAIPYLDYLVDHSKIDQPGYANFKTRYALLLFSIDSTTLAKKRFTEIIYDPFIKDSTFDDWFGNGEVQGNYKHLSCQLLGTIYSKEGKFDLSIVYFEMARDSFPYYHTDKSFVIKRNLDECIELADTYSKSGNLNMAFEYLFPYFENGEDPGDRAQYKAAYALFENKEVTAMKDLMSKDFHAILDKETIVLKLSKQNIVLADFMGQNKTQAELELKAKHYWNLITKSIMMTELKGFVVPKNNKPPPLPPPMAKQKPRPSAAPTPPPLNYPGRK